MATDLERLVVQLSADVKGYQNALNRAQGITNRQARAIESRFEKMNSNINASFRGLLTGSVAGIGTALGTREIAQYADAWTEAGNKINAAAQSAGVQARSLSQLKDGANEARSAFGDYADLYARLIRSASNVAKNENEIATATSVVAKAFKAGGAAASEQAAGILQLGQALGSGVLQGDELRSLRENAPILADAIAKEFKTTISGLKELGAEGKLTSDRVFKAILNAQKPIEAQFAATNATIGDAFTRLKNQMMEYVGGSDSAFGASAKLNEALGLLSNNIGAVADAAIIMAGAFLVNYAGNAANAAVAATYKMVAANTAQRVASVESARTALASAQAIQASAAANLQYAQTALVAARNGTALGLSVQQASRAMVVAQAGSGGWLTKLFSGFAEGGYTGDGGKYQPAGVVHKGEYVFDKAAVQAAGGPAAMEAMRRNLKGYANGGAVGVSVPTIPSLRPANDNAVKVNYAPVIDARGADAAAVARLEKVVAKQGAEMQGRVEAAVRSAQKRNVKLG
ncbi:tape measure protein [Agrobacterium sp. CG160-95]